MLGLLFGKNLVSFSHSLLILILEFLDFELVLLLLFFQRGISHPEQGSSHHRANKIVIEIHLALDKIIDVV